MAMLRVCFEVQGLARDADGNACPGGLSISLGEEAAERAAQEAEGKKENLARWKRLGQEFERLGNDREEVARMWVGVPEPEQIEALSSLLDGSMPENPNCFDLDLGWELCDSFLVADFAAAGLSLDYVLTGKRSEVSAQPTLEWLPLQWIPGKEQPTRLLDAACVFGCSERTAIKGVATWDGVQWIDFMGEPWILPCLRWFPIPDGEGGEQ